MLDLDMENPLVSVSASFQTTSPNFPDLLFIQQSTAKGGLNKVRYAENIYLV